MVLHGIGVEAPDTREQHLFREVIALGLEQEAHDVELLGGQAHALRAADEHAGGEIERGVAEAQLVHLIALPPEQRVDAGQQFARVERLRQVIVGAGVQALDPILELALGGQHQDRRRAALSPNLTGQVVAVELRHHDVQDQQVVDACLGIIFSSLAVVGDLDGEALFLKQGF